MKENELLRACNVQLANDLKDNEKVIKHLISAG